MITLKQRIFLKAIPIFLGIIGCLNISFFVHADAPASKCNPSRSPGTYSRDYFIKSLSTRGGSETISFVKQSGYQVGYEDLTKAYTLAIIRGRTFSFDFEFIGKSTIDFDGHTMAVYVDWDRNGFFTEEGELLHKAYSKGSTNRGLITTPTNTMLGSFRMRVVAAKGDNKPVTCGLMDREDGNGYAIDVTLIITNGEPCTTFPKLTNITPENVPPICAQDSSTVLTTKQEVYGFWTTDNQKVATIHHYSGKVYAWDQGTTTASYSYVTSDGCASSVSKELTVNGHIPVISGDNHLCIGGQSQFETSIKGGKWTSAQPESFTVDESGLVTAHSECSFKRLTYSLTNSPSGCVTIDINYITIKKEGEDPGQLNGEDQLCANSTIILTSTVKGGDVYWSSSNEKIATVSAKTKNGENNGEILGKTSGEVTITYKRRPHSLSCWMSVSKTITVQAPNASFSLPTNQLCIESSINATAQETGGTWATTDEAIATIDENGQITSVELGNVGIVYTQTSENGCTSSDTVQIKVVDQFEVGTLSEDEEICNGDQSLILSSSNYGGTWTTSENENVATIDINGNVQPTSAGQATFTYTIPQMGKCEAVSAPKSITVLANPEVPTITGSNTICQGSTLQLTASAENVEWKSDNENAVTIDTKGKITGVKAGELANITVTVGDLCKTSSEPFAVAVTETPNAGTIEGNKNVCLGSENIIYTIKDASEVGTWSVSDTTKANIDETTGTLTPIAKGNIVLTYTIEAKSCDNPEETQTLTATFDITIVDGQQTPTFDSTLFNDLCLGATAPTLPTKSIEGIEGTWLPATIDVTKVGTTKYVFSTNIGECTLSISKSVKVNDTAAPEFDESLFAGICKDATAPELPKTSTNGVEGIWTPAIIETSKAEESEYVFTVTKGQCSTADKISKTVTVNPLPTVEVSASEETICVGAETTLTASGAETYSWDNEIESTEAKQTVSPAQTTEYTVTGTDINGCSNTAKVSIQVVKPIETEGLAIEGPDSVQVEKTQTYTATIENGTWATSDTTIATINEVSGELKALKLGKVTISYTIANEAPCEDKVSVEKEIIIAEEVVSGVADIESVSQVSLSPNPATDEVNVSFYLQSATNVTIDIIDVNGTLIETVCLKNGSAGNNLTTFDVSEYASGIYSVVVRSNDSQITQKLVVTK